MWNTVLLVFGWAVARFGFFGVDAEIPSNVGLNYAGVAITAASGIFYLFIKNETRSNEDSQSLINNDPTDINHITDISVVLNNENPENESNLFTRLNPNAKRIIGIVLSCTSGVLFAFTFTPALYVQDNYPDASKNALDYVFSLYTGK